MTSTNKATSLLLFLAFALLAAPAHAATYNWDGSQNNNWDNGPNWFGASGWPDSATDDAVFDTDNYSLNDRDVDLRGGTFDVGLLNMDGAHDQLTFFSSTAQQGTLRLNGNMDYTQSAFTGNGLGHQFNIDLEVVGNSTWIGGEGHRVAISGELQGSGDITTLVDIVNLRGFELIRLNSANSYSGHLTIQHGYVTLADTNALQNAQVTLNWDNSLRMNNDIDANIGRLSGSGNLNVGAGTFTTNTSLNSSFSGNITGSTTGQFKKNGTGTLTLTGDISNIEWVQNGSGGNLVLDGNSATIGELVASLGELTLQNGADVNMSGSGIARSGSVGTLKVTGAGTQLRNGAELAATNGTGEGTINILNSASVSGFDIVTAGKLGTGDIIVQQDATVSADALGLGGKDALENGGTGELSVLTGGHVAISGETRLWTNTSGLFVFGDGTMTTGTLTSPGGTSPTIQLSDPSGGGPSLTLGTNDAVAEATFTGVIEDLGANPSSIEKVGANTQVLAGNNTFTGGITINGGTLGLAHNNAAGTGAITVLGSTIDYADTVNISNPIDLQNNVTLNVDTGSATQSGVISETGSSFDITKTGAGSLVLSAANTFTGTTQIDGGSIVLGTSFALRNSTVQINVNNGLGLGVGSAVIAGLSGAGDIDLGSADLWVGWTGNDVVSTTYSGILSGTGNLNKIHGDGALTLTAANTFSGETNIQAGQIVIGNANALQNSTVRISINDGLDVTTNTVNASIGALAGSKNLNLGSQTLTTGNNGDSTTYSGILSGTGDLNKTGAGTLTLTAANTFSGATTIDAGQIVIGNANALQNSTVVLLVNNGLNLNGFDATIAGIAGLPGSSNLDLANSTLTIGNNNVSSPIYAGIISGTGSLNKIGSGDLGLIGNNTFSGGVTLNEGRFGLGNVNAAGTGPITVTGPATIAYATNTTSNQIDLQSNVMLEVQSVSSVSSTQAGVIGETGGSFGITKTGDSKLVLTANNTYTGGTTIDGGTLLANNTTGSATGSGSVAVNTGGTLGGTGSVAGIVTVNSGGTLAPGVSPGTLTVEDIVFNAGSTFAVELAGDGGVAGVDFDQLVVNNGATLGGTLDLSLVNPFTLSPGLSFEILDVGGSLAGTFSGLSQGALVGNFGGTDLFINYAAGDGNDISLMATFAGDFDLNFDVDGADFLKWQRGFGDIYDANDLTNWSANYGSVASAIAAPASSAVPEPSTLLLGAMASIVGISLRRRS